ncbi:hydrogenase expression/formation protein [Oryzibacter oryziterrae]|uniref:hydrogenase expression/formation protein n=1 Tax=Oryzibacter oryziterrae TaxID=2766474 RepID=UPI001F203A23|nr:hydrogenase expression/formation protein [Oryzibacter oryziterrae]
MREEKVVRHVLLQVEAALDQLGKGGSPSTIDLRQVPGLEAKAYQLLKSRLGSGEVSASIATSDGVAETVRAAETAFSGVWWITHHNGAGDTVTEQIEICPFPAIFAAHPEEIRDSAVRLGPLCNQNAEVEAS